MQCFINLPMNPFMGFNAVSIVETYCLPRLVGGFSHGKKENHVGQAFPHVKNPFPDFGETIPYLGRT
ncbi:hypothetical protein KKC74_06275, partial [bacterium]|nr:hypothetical protein [bacterium]